MPQTGEINKDGLTFVKGYGWITTERYNQLFADKINGPPANSSSGLPPDPEEEPPTTAPPVNHFVDVTALAHPPTPTNTPPNEGSTYPESINLPENPSPNEGSNPPFQDNYFFPNPAPNEAGTPPFEGSYFPPSPENTPPFEGNTYPTSFPENIPPSESGGFPTPFPVETPPIESSGYSPVNIPPNEDIGFPNPIGAPQNVPPDESGGFPTPIPQNTPPDDFSQPPTEDSYYPAGVYNVPPDEDMTATPADVYYLPDGTGGYKVIDPNTGQPVDSIPGSPLPAPETGLPSSGTDEPTNTPSDTQAVTGPPTLNLNPSPSVQSPFSDAMLLPGATPGLGSFDPGSIETIGGKLYWHKAQPLFGGKTLAQVAKQNPELLPGLANMGAGFSPGGGGWQGTSIGPGGVSEVSPK